MYSSAWFRIQPWLSATFSDIGEYCGPGATRDYAGASDLPECLAIGQELVVIDLAGMFSCRWGGGKYKGA